MDLKRLFAIWPNPDTRILLLVSKTRFTYVDFMITPFTHSLDKLRLPFRHLIHRVLLPLGHKAQPITIPLAILNPHIRERCILNPTVLRHDFLLLAQQLIQLHIAEEGRPARLRSHTQPTAVIPVYGQIRTHGELDGA